MHHLQSLAGIVTMYPKKLDHFRKVKRNNKMEKDYIQELLLNIAAQASKASAFNELYYEEIDKEEPDFAYSKEFDDDVMRDEPEHLSCRFHKKLTEELMILGLMIKDAKEALPPIDWGLELEEEGLPDAPPPLWRSPKEGKI